MWAVHGQPEGERRGMPLEMDGFAVDKWIHNNNNYNNNAFYL